ncbi:MAG: porin [Myxococcota bacterium]|jgi:phosphate-selective porin OprO/OprP|nr:porin [Myxococcota bacterium]
MSGRIAVACLLAGLAWLAPFAPAVASDRVARALLEALKANGTIDAKQYEDLSRLVEDEAAAEAQEAAATPAVAAPRPGALDVFWNQGIRLESADGAFKLRIGGRLQNDWGVLSPDQDLREELPNEAGQGSGTDWRRARLALSGSIYERIGTKLEFDFVGGDASLRDAYIELMKLPYVGTFRVGHYKEPMSLDELTSDSYTMFIERSVMNAFAPSRNTGFMLQNAPLEQRMTWAFGAFRATDDTTGNGFSDDGTYNLTGRVTGLPWYENDGTHLLHLGVSVTQKFLDQTSARIRQRPEVRLGNPFFVDTGSIEADGAQVVNPELALVYGPFSFQAEYAHTFLQANDTPDPDFYGLYAQASWFLTGESRPYKTSEGIFDRVAPERNFDLKGGLGAWELALRYSRLDLDDADIEGGQLDDGTVGLNWYLNPNVKTSFNYVAAKLNGVGWTNQFVTRFQIDF